MNRLLSEFLSQDCNAAVRQTLLDEIRLHSTTKTTLVVREFTFNRFNVVLDFLAGNARIEDELDPSAQGSCRIPLSEFSAVLEMHEPGSSGWAK